MASPKRGLEEPTQQGDLEIPRAKLLQALSPEVVDGNDGCRPGVVINSLTKEVMPFEFVPVFKFTNWIHFNPRDPKDPAFNPEFGAGDIIWRSSDPNDPRVIAESTFGKNGEKPKAVTFLNFFSYFPGVPMPVVLSFSKTSYRAGRHLLSLVRFSDGDMFSKKYKLGVKQEKNDMGAYFVFTINQAGQASEEEYSLCEGLWSEFSRRKDSIKVHEEGQEEAPVESQERPY